MSSWRLRLCCTGTTAAVGIISGADLTPEEGIPPQMNRLRTDLEGLGVGALAARASAVGIDEGTLYEAMDGGKASMVQLIIENATRVAATAASKSAVLREELGRLKLGALHRRALVEGAAAGDVLAAADQDDPHEAIIQLVIDTVATATAESPRPGSDSAGQRPHFGVAPAENTSEQPGIRSTKHVMLSYNWEHQTQVKRVFDILTKLGLNVWMDVAGGMSTDIYDSMAKGVANASVVVCFMSQKYQESQNCMLEAKFAMQSGIELVPVLMEGEGWRASGWLGLLTAGSLWTPLYEDLNFEENVRGLCGQIQKKLLLVASDVEQMAADASLHDEQLASRSEAEAKEELERLRADIAPAAKSSGLSLLADPSQLATIPAGVPKLPTRFQPTTQIRQLTELVLSTKARDMLKSRVGFYGMGEYALIWFSELYCQLVVFCGTAHTTLALLQAE